MYDMESTCSCKKPPLFQQIFCILDSLEIENIQVKDFGKIQKDRVSKMKRWARFVKKAIEEHLDRLDLAIVAANNHCTGFGPGTANTLRKMLDLSEETWNEGYPNL